MSETPPTIPWTKEQLSSITTTGRSVLVSAAAGSGKTAVLAERCAYLICDAPQPCEVSELLVVTYTQAAAAEMRTRIEAAIRRRVGTRDDPRLNKQLMLVGGAQISTLHSFCSRVLRQHFQAAQLDPNFRLLNEDEARLLRRDVGLEMLEEQYEKDESGVFQRFVEQHGNNDDRNTLKQIIQIHDLLGSVIDRQGWLDRAVARVVDGAAAKRLIDSDLGHAAQTLLSQSIADLKRRGIELAERIEQAHGADRYLDHVGEILSIVVLWQQLIEAGDFEALAANACAMQLPRLPIVKNQEALKASINAFKESFKRGLLADMCGFSEAEWRDGLKRIAPATELLVQLTRDFDTRYSAAKLELRALDFSDLERLTLSVLRADQRGAELHPSDVAKSYQKQFKHLLVDEYQDVNEVQDAILHLLSRESVHGKDDQQANLFSVGDVKQSIYRFRLAEPARFLERYEKLKSPTSTSDFGTVVDLAQNFRTRGTLLQTLNGLFDRLMTLESAGIDYSASHRLVAGAEFPPQGESQSFHEAAAELHLLPAEPQIQSGDDDDVAEDDLELERTEREAAYIAHQIKQLLIEKYHVGDRSVAGGVGLRPLRVGDCVILLRAMKFKSEQFAAILRNAGLAVHSDSSSGFFESMEVRDMLSLLRLLDNQRQDVPLAAVLRSPIAGLDQVDDLLANIRLAHPDADEVPFHQAVLLFAQHNSSPAAAPLRQFLTQLNAWRSMAHLVPVAELIWRVYNQTGYLAFCSGLPDGAQREANLLDFHQRAQRFGDFQRQGLTRFIAHLNELEEDTDIGQPSAAGAADDAVRIMSIHRAKGLEFPVVFVPDLGKQHNLRDTQGSVLIDRAAGIGLIVPDPVLRVQYPSLAHLLARNQIRRASLTEELRVLYVALTRAKEKLYLVGTIEPEKTEELIEQGRRLIGPMPGEAVLSARTTLDWLLPVAGAMAVERSAYALEIHAHTAQEIAQWCEAARRRPQATPAQAALAQLQPFADAPPRSEQARLLIQRLTWRYPHAPLTKDPAVQSVGALAKSSPNALPLSANAQSASSQTVLESPKFILGERRLNAAEIGSATHRVLQLLDFARAETPAQISAQVDDFVERWSLTAAEAKAVDVSSVGWLMTTPLGALLRAHAAELRREVSIFYPQASPGLQGLDRVMIRGRIDLMFTAADGMVLVDFKTDRVATDQVSERAARYRPQLASYRDALQGILERSVAGAYLVFLTAKEIVPV